ncbi:uromodulin-like, partial [Scleropages formosus]
MCGRDFITIVVIEDLFMYHSVKLEELHVGNGTCQVRRETVAGVSYMVRTPKKKYICCSGKLLEKNLTHITYSQTLQSHPNDSVLRHPAVTVEYKCAYLSICRVTLPFPIVPFSRETVIQVDAMVVFSLFTDSRYTQLHLGKKAFVKLRVTEPQDFFHLRVTECWASLSPSPSDANDSARMETVQFFTGTSGLDSMNKGSPVARFRFNMFHFQTAVRKLQLHCIMWLHSLDSTVSGCGFSFPRMATHIFETLQAQVCKPITKWEAVVEETTQGLLSYEPIRLKEPDRAGCSNGKQQQEEILTLEGVDNCKDVDTGEGQGAIGEESQSPGDSQDTAEPQQGHTLLAYLFHLLRLYVLASDLLHLHKDHAQHGSAEQEHNA